MRVNRVPSLSENVGPSTPPQTQGPYTEWHSAHLQAERQRLEALLLGVVRKEPVTRNELDDMAYAVRCVRAELARRGLKPSDSRALQELIRTAYIQHYANVNSLQLARPTLLNAPTNMPLELQLPWRSRGSGT